MKSSRFLSIYFPAIFASLLWAIPFAGIKIGLQYMTPFMFAGVRFMLSGVFVLLYIAAINKFQLRRVWDKRPAVKDLLVVALFQTVFMYVLYYLGLDWVPGAESAILMGASPLVIAMLAHFTSNGSDRMHARKVFSLLLGFSGVILMAVNKQFSESANWTLGLGMAFLFVSIIMGGIGQLYIKKKDVPDIILLNGLQLFLGGMVLIILSSLFEGNPIRMESGLDLRFYTVLMLLSLISAVAFSVWYKLINRKDVKVSEVNLVKFLIPVFGSIFAWIILPNEHFNLISFFGMLLIASSILFYFSRNKNS